MTAMELQSIVRVLARYVRREEGEHMGRVIAFPTLRGREVPDALVRAVRGPEWESIDYARALERLRRDGEVRTPTLRDAEALKELARRNGIATNAACIGGRCVVRVARGGNRT